MKKITVFLIISIIIFSCSPLLQVEKRRHMKGYYIQLSLRKDNPGKSKSNKVELREEKELLAIEQEIIPAEPDLGSDVTNLKTEVDILKKRESNKNISKEKKEISKKSKVRKVNNSQNSVKHLTNNKGNDLNINAQKNNGIGLLLFFGGLLGLLIAGIFKSNFNRAKKLSYWAKENIWLARGIITANKVILGLGALLLGRMLYDSDFYISESARNGLLSVFTVTALFYPLKKASGNFFKYSYLRQKKHDLVLAMSGIMLMTTLGNQAAADKDLVRPISYMYQTMDNAFAVADNSGNNISYLNVDLNRQLSKQKTYVQQKNIKDDDVFGKILVTILVVLLFLALEALVLALSCSLSCNGQEALAVIVGVGGTVGLISLLFLALQAVWQRGRYSR